MSISNHADVIDNRDVMARIGELQDAEAVLAEAQEAYDSCKDEDTETALEDAKDDFDEDDQADLAVLRALADEASDSPDWAYGETLIRESYFEEYAQELAEDVCEMGKAQDWPFCHIDWEAAAKSLQQDYSEVDFDGVTYLVRS